MNWLIEQIGQMGIIGLIIVFLVAITEFIFSLGMSSLLTSAKARFTKARAKEYTMLVLTVILLFSSVISIAVIKESLLKIFIIPILISGATYFVFCRLVAEMKNSILYESNTYRPNEKIQRMSVAFAIVILSISIFFISVEVAYFLNQIDNTQINATYQFIFDERSFIFQSASNGDHVSFANLNELKKVILPAVLAFITYIYTIYACSYLFVYADLNDLNKFIITIKYTTSPEGGYRKLVCYLISEDDKEIVMKPESSRAISIKKELILEMEYANECSDIIGKFSNKLKTFHINNQNLFLTLLLIIAIAVVLIVIMHFILLISYLLRS